jgi:hypothetical protein
VLLRAESRAFRASRCFARRSRDVCALFVRDVLVVVCWLVRVRARRARCFVYRQRAMSRVSARRLHAIVLFHAS